jgi:hypothetical protein
MSFMKHPSPSTDQTANGDNRIEMVQKKINEIEEQVNRRSSIQSFRSVTNMKHSEINAVIVDE